MSAFQAHPKHARESPDAVGRGVLGDDPEGPATLFVLAGASLGATAIAGEGNPRWYDLRRLVSLDAVGDDVGGRVPIEAEFDGGDVVRALWPEPFCDKVVTRLRELLDSGQMAPKGDGDAPADGPTASPSVSERSRDGAEPIEATATEERATEERAPGPDEPAAPPPPTFAPGAAGAPPGLFAPAAPPEQGSAAAFAPPVPPPAAATPPPAAATPPPAAFAPPPDAPEAAPPAPPPEAAPSAEAVPAPAPAPPGPGSGAVSDFAESPPAWSASETPLPGEGPALATPANAAGESELVLHDVVYHGGYPGQSKKRKKCTAVLNSHGLAVSGPSGPDFKLAWDTVTSVEAQNADEAKFRLNIRPKRNSTALVFDCGQGVSVVLEAREVPTLPLRGALTELLAGRSVRIA